ncbi:MAG: 23S rRNA (uracil(1939)-C(5))-methyltransferase RlmD [Myxococcota bacterium]
MGRDGELSLGARVEARVDPEDRLSPSLSARLEDGRSITLSGALPGERVVAEIEHISQKKRLFGRVISILEASPHRIAPSCRHFLRCGGCDYLHLDPAEELRHKRRDLEEVLGLEVSEVIASPRPLGYRALAKLVVGPDGTLGSYAAYSHRLVDMQGCLVHAPLVESIADALRAVLRPAPPRGLRYALIRGAFFDGRAVVTLVFRALEDPGALPLAEALAARPEVARVVVAQNDSDSDALLVGGPERVLLDRGWPVERVGPVEQWLDAGAFAQVNPAAAALLYARAAALAAPKGKSVLDLYSGSGGLGLTMAEAGARAVFMIERVEEAVEAARRAASRRGGPVPVEALAASVSAASLRDRRAEVIVANPPRGGLAAEVVEALAEKAPFRLVYVSCNPVTLARDRTLLRSRARLTQETLVGVDLFPRTRHLEALYAADVS